MVNNISMWSILLLNNFMTNDLCSYFQLYEKISHKQMDKFVWKYASIKLEMHCIYEIVYNNKTSNFL